MEAPETGAAITETADALKIEEVLQRAHEIHRRHGGIFGYDFEDWVQAWSDLPGSSSRRDFAVAGETRSEAIVGTEVSKTCFRYDN